MSRPLRIQFAGACYHLTSRGDRREAIFADDADRAIFLTVLQQGLQRFHARLLAYCLMGNHYHLVLVTEQPNLSLLMRHLNGVYTQDFNRRHNLVGHLFQGRFKAVLVDSDRYLMALCRYVELNPVRARLVSLPGDWAWSSYRAHIGEVQALTGLDVAALHAFMLERPCRDARDHALAARRYREAVGQTGGEALWETELRQQVFLGDAAFVARMQSLAEHAGRNSREIPCAQRLTQERSLAHWLAACPNRASALLAAQRESGLTLTAMAAELGLSVSRVSRLISREEARLAAAQGAKGKT